MILARPTRRRFLATGLSGLWGTLAGCQGSDDDAALVRYVCSDLDADVALVRFVNGLADSGAVDAHVRGKRLIGGLGGGQVSGYCDIDPGYAALSFTPAGAHELLAGTGRPLGREQCVTALLLGPPSGHRVQLIEEAHGEAAVGKTRVRLFHGAPGIGALDLYLTGLNDSLAGAAPRMAGAEPGTTGAFVELDAEEVRVRLTRAGDPAMLLFDSAAVSLPSRGTLTLAAVPGLQGPLLPRLIYLPEGDLGHTVPNALNP